MKKQFTFAEIFGQAKAGAMTGAGASDAKRPRLNLDKKMFGRLLNHTKVRLLSILCHVVRRSSPGPESMPPTTNPHNRLQHLGAQ